MSNLYDKHNLLHLANTQWYLVRFVQVEQIVLNAERMAETQNLRDTGA